MSASKKKEEKKQKNEEIIISVPLFGRAFLVTSALLLSTAASGWRWFDKAQGLTGRRGLVSSLTTFDAAVAWLAGAKKHRSKGQRSVGGQRGHSNSSVHSTTS